MFFYLWDVFLFYPPWSFFLSHLLFDNTPPFFCQILYVDSLAVDNVQISTTPPRVAAWTREHLDQVIKLDRNNDGSFGKLKVLNFLVFPPLYFLFYFFRPQFFTCLFCCQIKQSGRSVIQNSLFNMEDICRFVASKAPQQMPSEVRHPIHSKSNYTIFHWQLYLCIIASFITSVSNF